MENINKLEIVPGEVYEIGADKVPVIPEWSVKDDTTLLQEVKALAHSTFDRSKFTVTGSPTITNDGIASGFTANGNSILLYPFTASDFKGHSWKVKAKWVNTNADTSLNTNKHTQGLLSFQYNYPSAGSITIGQNYTSSGDLVKFSVGFWGNTAITGESSNEGLHINKVYSDTPDFCIATLDFNYDTGEYRLWADIGEGDEYIGSWTPSTSQKELNVIYTGSSANIRQGAGVSTYVCDAIDLKHTYMEIDGVEVFSGNRTGIDTIKPDDYDAVGTPVITNDGILSSSTTNTNNFVRSFIYFPNINAANFKLYAKIKIKRLPTGTDVCNYMNGTFWGWITSNTLVVSAQGYRASDGVLANAWLTEKNIINNGLLNKYIDIVWENDVVQGIRAGLKTKEDNDYTYTAWDNTFSHSAETNKLQIGLYTPDGESYFDIDLNSVRFYVNDVLVWQPLLKIPYTEGQNYVKVVDKLYRDRVKDLFEQKGYNGYYTIGEDDFTLPSNKWSDVIEHKENGLTVAEQRVDQTLTIRGACEQGVDVNLPMEFFSDDSYAVFGVGTTGTNTASKFTPAVDGNYIAIGKGKV